MKATHGPKNKRAQPSLWAGVLLVVAVGLSGCGTSTVRSVHEQPQRHWFNSTVRLEGTVIDRVPLLNAQIYQLQDKTGAIWIMTTDTSVQAGMRIAVKGKVHFQSIPIAEQELGEAYIEEHLWQSLETNDAK